MFNFDDLIRDSDIPKDEHGIPIISDDMSMITTFFYSINISIVYLIYTIY